MKEVDKIGTHNDFKLFFNHNRVILKIILSIYTKGKYIMYSFFRTKCSSVSRQK